MVALATKLYHLVPFREASADQLPFPDTVFDAAVCAFGVGHFPEPERVLAEMTRVLAPGGVAALAWWDDFSRNRINGIFHETILRLGVSAPGAVPAGPPMDRFSDRERFAALLRAARLRNVRVEQVTFEHLLRDADELWEMAMGSFARASSVIGAQSDEMQRQIKAAVSDAASPYKSANGLAIPVAFLIASGVR
jgi:SAM-dependent methyltransferase